MGRLLLIAVLFASSATFASARLFPQLSVLSLTTPPDLLGSPAVVAEPSARLLLATGVAAALFATPTSLMLGQAVGSLSNNLYAAALPALLIALLLPPLAVVFSEWMTAEKTAPGRFRLLPALAVAWGTQLILLAGAVLLGVSGVTSSGIALVTIADMVALPMVTTAMLRWTERAPTVTTELMQSHGAVASFPLASGSF